MTRWDIINFLIRKNNYKSYLEIGYFKGWSFDNVNCLRKDATDPNPSKSIEQEALRYGDALALSNSTYQTLHKMASDDFFRSRAGAGEWDIIFIDGLHEAQQVYNDIMNSLQHLSPGGTIVLHDCNPPTLLHATTGDAGGNWNGDVYKAFVKFQMQYPEYEAYTVDTDWGCGIIHTPPREGMFIDNTWNDIKGVIDDWDYFDRNRASLLNLISVEEFIKKNHEETKDNNVPA